MYFVKFPKFFEIANTHSEVRKVIYLVCRTSFSTAKDPGSMETTVYFIINYLIHKIGAFRL